MKTIVIDAGHGGKDPGNLGTGRYKTKEKDIALDVALRVGGYIKKQFPEIDVIYTRDTDVFIGLNERADIANKAKADLFLSIHCNAFPNPNSNGVETWVLGLHKNQENLEVAMKENSAIFLEDDYKTKYEGFDPNSAESIIALTIMQSAFLQQSLSISSYIQEQFRERVGRRDRGVKQAGFLVLRKTTMPSILIELGFLTNKAEEDFLNTENGKAYMSSAIFRGFKEYKELVEDPLPEGYVDPVSSENAHVTISKAEEEAAKQAELDALMKAAEQAKSDSIQKVEDQARIKVVADSLEREKQRLVEEKQEREEALRKAEEEKNAKLKAQADSLAQVKQQKLEEMKQRQAEIAAEKAKEEEELRAKEEAERLAKEEEERKAQEAKENAKEWLEEIKAEKERELAEAQKTAAIEVEKKRLEEIKQEKLRQLEEAREKAEQDSLNAITQQQLVEAKARAKKDSIAFVEAKTKAKADSVQLAKLKAEQLKTARLKREQDSIAVVRKAEAERIKTQIGDKKTTSPAEAELLFLQLRKKQLEEKIARLKGKNVKPPTKEILEERAVEKQVSVNRVDTTSVLGLVLKVQVLTSANPLSKTDPKFRGQEVWEYQQGGLYKYTVGGASDFEEITKLQSELRNLGFKGAFVVAFKDGERIKVSDAREMLNKGE